LGGGSSSADRAGCRLVVHPARAGATFTDLVHGLLADVQLY
jgi:hypothetical protein